MAERPIFRLPPAGWSDFGAHMDRPGVPSSSRQRTARTACRSGSGPSTASLTTQEILP